MTTPDSTSQIQNGNQGGSDASGSQNGQNQNAQNGSTGSGPERAGQELSREALEAELARARKDAGKYRDRAREFGDDETYKRAKDALSAVEKAEQEKKSEVEKLTEKNEGLQFQASKSDAALRRIRVALAQGIDSTQVDEFAARLQGETDDDLKADAEKLAKFFNTSNGSSRRSDPSQGAGSEGQPAGDPLVEMLTGVVGLNQ